MNTPQTDTPHPQAPDFGEPWEPSYEMLFDRDGDYVGEFQPPFHNSSEVVARAIACVNALAGIPDPAEFVRQAKEMREAVKRIANWRGDCDAYNEAIREVAHAMDNLIIAKRGGMQPA